WLDIEHDEAAGRLLGLAGLADLDPTRLPVVLMPSGSALVSPSNLDLANALGLRTQAQQPLYDLCIVGAGPAGLAAAVYAASEGLSTVSVERAAPRPRGAASVGRPLHRRARSRGPRRRGVCGVRGSLDGDRRAGRPGR